MTGNSQGSKQTSDRLSSLAASLLRMNNEEISDHATLHPEDIRTLAASVLVQDETKGPNDNADERTDPA